LPPGFDEADRWEPAGQAWDRRRRSAAARKPPIAEPERFRRERRASPGTRTGRRIRGGSAGKTRMVSWWPPFPLERSATPNPSAPFPKNEGGLYAIQVARQEQLRVQKLRVTSANPANRGGTSPQPRL